VGLTLVTQYGDKKLRTVWNQIREAHMIRAREEKCAQSFGKKASRREVNYKVYA
jgi:hypothetical protein